MNAKQSKMMRKMAQGMPAAKMNQETSYVKKVSKVYRDNTGQDHKKYTVILSPSCVRYFYQQLKKNYQAKG